MYHYLPIIIISKVLMKVVYKFVGMSHLPSLLDDSDLVMGSSTYSTLT